MDEEFGCTAGSNGEGDGVFDEVVVGGEACRGGVEGKVVAQR